MKPFPMAPYGTPQNPIPTRATLGLIAELQQEGFIAQAQELQELLAMNTRNCGHHPERAPC